MALCLEVAEHRGAALPGVRVQPRPRRVAFREREGGGRGGLVPVMFHVLTEAILSAPRNNGICDQIFIGTQ